MLSWLFAKPDPPDVIRICAGTSLSRHTARRILKRFDTKRYAEIADLLLAQDGDHILHDPIEDLPEFVEIFKLATADTDSELLGIQRGIGFCHRFWDTKKKILACKYGVDWLSLGDMNPGARFD